MKKNLKKILFENYDPGNEPLEIQYHGDQQLYYIDVEDIEAYVSGETVWATDPDRGMDDIEVNRENSDVTSVEEDELEDFMVSGDRSADDVNEQGCTEKEIAEGTCGHAPDGKVDVHNTHKMKPAGPDLLDLLGLKENKVHIWLKHHPQLIKEQEVGTGQIPWMLNAPITSNIGMDSCKQAVLQSCSDLELQITANCITLDGENLQENNIDEVVSINFYDGSGIETVSYNMRILDVIDVQNIYGVPSYVNDITYAPAGTGCIAEAPEPEPEQTPQQTPQPPEDEEDTSTSDTETDDTSSVNTGNTNEPTADSWLGTYSGENGTLTQADFDFSLVMGEEECMPHVQYASNPESSEFMIDSFCNGTCQDDTYIASNCYCCQFIEGAIDYSVSYDSEEDIAQADAIGGSPSDCEILQSASNPETVCGVWWDDQTSNMNFGIDWDVNFTPNMDYCCGTLYGIGDYAPPASPSPAPAEPEVDCNSEESQAIFTGVGGIETFCDGWCTTQWPNALCTCCPESTDEPEIITPPTSSGQAGPGPEAPNPKDYKKGGSDPQYLKDKKKYLAYAKKKK